ncbi:methyltransferase domain-containing protein [bacterium 3DAC]|nr:methyltransferase domain-containing protein [bacterium 3DAC]
MLFRSWGNIIKDFFGKGVFPHYTSFFLELPFRKLILSPKQLANRLHLKKDYHVLEIGPGPGYFSVEVAKRLSQGHLDLLDIQKEMLEKAKRKIVKLGLTNVTFTQGDATNLPYNDSTFDVVFLVAVLGEIPKPSLCISEIHRVLKPHGILSITEQPGDPDFLPMPRVKKLAEKHGFRVIEQYGKGKNYTLNFIKTTQL